MKLLLIGLDGVRVDVALPQALTMHRGFEEPDHPADPRFAAGERPADAPTMPSPALSTATPAPTLARLLDGGCVLPVWMTPPTDSGPGWASLLTGTRHEENNVWWNEFVGHRLARTPDILSRIYFANPSARTFAASTWDALVDPSGPGPVFHQRVDQQVGGQHQLMKASDFSEGCRSADTQVRGHAAWVLNHEGPDAAFVYFEDVDEAGHQHGAASAEYREAITRVDEHVRHLVKAVSERYEQLDEEWLVAVVTDHGHKPEGGHGEDEVDVRRSFLLLHHIGPADVADDLRARASGVPSLRSEEVTPLLLDLLGAQSGSWDPHHDVGRLRDVATVGPTRNLEYEW
ncbi:alkaline phosphatase family protein [Brachybacterium alimentarium]|uniref:alkaline phosphatase family protein n=1 Tax=Brachybacterium alimentarium TaxID=47845 RepID=UPI000DF37C36|nr:alkaline phosphatase family protein [Brachybacterium alimentarium]RCS75552.1 alkaline phosphatase family protein [Brachybacterium alimentarium]